MNGSEYRLNQSFCFSKHLPQLLPETVEGTNRMKYFLIVGRRKLSFQTTSSSCQDNHKKLFRNRSNRHINIRQEEKIKTLLLQ